MLIEKVDNYQSKKDEKFRTKAALLSMRAREAAGVVQQFGTAVIDGAQLISAGDISQMVFKLNYYADWLFRISEGEEVTEEDLVRMEEIIAKIRIPKKNKYKRGIIEVVYVAEENGKATRHKLYESKVDSSNMLQGNTLEFNFTIGENGYAKRLPKKH